MLTVFAKSIFSFMAVMLLLSVVNIGCSSRHLDQNQQNILEQPQEKASEQGQKTVPSAKPEGMSIFTVIISPFPKPLSSDWGCRECRLMP